MGSSAKIGTLSGKEKSKEMDEQQTSDPPKSKSPKNGYKKMEIPLKMLVQDPVYRNSFDIKPISSIQRWLLLNH